MRTVTSTPLMPVHPAFANVRSVAVTAPSAPLPQFGKFPRSRDELPAIFQKGWIKNNISQPFAEKVGKKLKLSRRGVAVTSSLTTLGLIGLLHVPIAVPIYNGVVSKYKGGLDTYEEAAELGNVFKEQCTNCDVHYETDPKTGKQRMVITETDAPKGGNQ